MAGSKNSKSTGAKKTTARSNRRGLAKSSTTLKKSVTPVQKTIAETNHGLVEYMVITNGPWWDKLPADVRDGLSKAMAEATAHANKLAQELNERDMKRIAEAGKAKIQKLSKDDVAAWRKAMHPVWKKFEGDIGADLIQAAQKSNK